VDVVIEGRRGVTVVVPLYVPIFIGGVVIGLLLNRLSEALFVSLTIIFLMMIAEFCYVLIKRRRTAATRRTSYWRRGE